MQKLLIAGVLSLAACAANPYPGTIPVAGPLQRQIERVVERYDVYIRADAALPAEELAARLEKSAELVALVRSLPVMSAKVLAQSLDQVMMLHDAYVMADPLLDELQRAVYLSTTAGLRALLAASGAYQPDPAATVSLEALEAATN